VTLASSDAGIQVLPYTPTHAAEWDAFVRSSRSGTFLFERDYQDYHADRFVDASYIVRDADGGIMALLPADRLGTQLRSHGGLTYGGFVVNSEMTLPRIGSVFAATAKRLRDDGIDTVWYKTIPSIYAEGPADDDRYWLFRHGARLVRRDVLSVVDLSAPGKEQEQRRRARARARKAGCEVREERGYGEFWEVLTANLAQRYGVAPVHSVSEIERLAAAFPENIRLLAARDREGRMMAGAVLYVSRQVCHVQYNASSPEGREIGALDLVLDHAMTQARGRVRWFDFGASTEQDGRHLNEGLVSYKESFGSRTIAQDFYEWSLTESGS
jgi:hypothetical protein